MSKLTTNNPKIIVALDFSDSDSAIGFARAHLTPSLCRVKVGKELFTACGPNIVDKLHTLGFQVFLDLKYHDIPETVFKAVDVAKELGIWMLNVHAFGGHTMMEAAMEGAGNDEDRPLVIGVTLLTSLDSTDLAELNIHNTPYQQVHALAHLARKSGLDGVVSSAQEVGDLVPQFPQTFKFVTPGIRPTFSNKNDQKRVVTPTQAIRNGASYLVIGRPITQAPDPDVVLRQIDNEIQLITVK